MTPEQAIHDRLRSAIRWATEALKGDIPSMPYDVHFAICVAMQDLQAARDKMAPLTPKQTPRRIP